jgi:hypothetical protein
MKSFAQSPYLIGENRVGLIIFWRFLQSGSGDLAGSPYRGKITIHMGLLQSGSPYGADECWKPPILQQCKRKRINYYFS